MTVLPDGTALGRLKLVEVYDYYDGPRLFAAQNATGSLFLSLWADETDAADTWLYLPISEEQLERVRAGQVDISQAYLQPEDGTVFLLTHRHAEKAWSLEVLTPAVLNREWLPPAGDSLQLREGVQPAGTDLTRLTESPIHWLRISRITESFDVSLEAVTTVLKAWRELFADALEELGSDTTLIPVGSAKGSFRLALEVREAAAAREVLRTLAELNAVVFTPDRLVAYQERRVSAKALMRLFRALSEYKVRLLVESEALSSPIEFSPTSASSLEHAYSVIAQSRMATDEIPQADDLRRVFRLIELKASHIDLTPYTLDVVPRQVSYYKQASRLLGYLSADNELSVAGSQLVALTEAERFTTTVVQFERSYCGWRWIQWARGETMLDVSPNSAEPFLLAASELSPTTAKRRAQTLRAWHNALAPFHYRQHPRERPR